MRQCNILCFSETFLNPHINIQQDQLPIPDDCEVYRLDRQHTDDAALSKGGVMIVCPRILQPTRLQIHAHIMEMPSCSNWILSQPFAASHILNITIC